MQKKYKLLQDYKTPCRIIYEGVIKTAEEWLKIFPEIINIYNLEVKKDWFEEVKEVKLEVPIGTKFKTYQTGSIYIIKEDTGETVKIYGCPEVEGRYREWEISLVNEYFRNGSWTIYKEPLFLDELENEVFEGDNYYYITKNWELIGTFQGKELRSDRLFRFKNKIDAENYINENKPMFSKKQILDAVAYAKQIYSRCDIIPEERFIEKLGL